MEFIATGAQADLYKKNGKAIKLFKKNVPKQDVEYEMKLQKMAFEIGLPVPIIYDVVEIDNKYGILMEFIDGIPVGKMLLENMNNIERYINQSIEIQIEMNKITASNFPSMKEKLKRKINRVNILDNNKKQNILEKLDKIMFKDNLCHGDFHVMNLLETPNGIKIIDWVDSSSGNSEFDVCRTYILYKESYEEISKIYLENYCKKTNTIKEEILNIAPIVATARLDEGFEEKHKILMEIINNCE